MKLNLNKERNLLFNENPESPVKFVCTEGAFGWVDLQAKDKDASFPWFVAAGLSDEDNIYMLEAYKAPLYELARKAVDSKDRLLIRKIYADASETDMMLFLRHKCDGLSNYASFGRDPLGYEQYVNKEEEWPNFRSRTTVASLSPVIQKDLSNFRAGYERLVDEIAKQTTIIDGGAMVLNNVLSPPLQEVFNHPALRAMIWVHNGLLRILDQRRFGKTYDDRSPYGNLGRKRR